MAEYPLNLELRDQDEVSVAAIALVAQVHDESNPQRWRDAAARIGVRLESLRAEADDGTR